jgi:methyl-accepting chemotaxis protein
MKLRLRTKLLFATQFAITLIFGTFIFYNGLKLEQQARENAYTITQDHTKRYALLCKNYLDKDMGFTKSLANSLETLQTFNPEIRDTIYGKMMLKMLQNNPKYISVWNTIELRFIDDNWKLDHGRKSLVTLRTDETIEIAEIFKDMEGDNPASAYYGMKNTWEPAIMEPYVDPDVGDFLITSLTTPVIINNQFAGLGGIDLPLLVIQDFIDQMEQYVPGETAMVLSGTGVIIGHTDKSLIGDTLKMNYQQRDKITAKIQKGETFIRAYSSNDIDYYNVIEPFLIDGTKTPWAFSLTIPLNTILADARAENRKILWLGILGIALFFIVIWIIASRIVNPLTSAQKSFQELAQGIVSDDQKLTIKTRDELQELGESANNLINGLQNTVAFAQEIERGNFEVDYQLLGSNDQLGQALLRMRDGLAELKKKDAERQNEDEKRNWASKGLVKFGDLLRKPAESIQEQMLELITELVSYSSANQGGIYLVNDENENDTYIELVASIAYTEEKIETKRIEIGEGLVGTCIKEQETVSLSDLPTDYLTINSGLGQHKPASLIIIPLKTNMETIGAMELASLKEFEPYQINFFQELGTSIATSVSTIKLNIQTSKLLEKTQEQAEAMQAQEEELRQNMEEMLATQEESSRRIEELESQLKAALSKK